ncbi:GroES-like protein [Trametes polyzona]|nr:GroES-like protein [Trametes polyzona]
MPSQQKALVLESKCGPLVLKDVPVPTPGPGQLLVRVEAAALNPADWKVVDFGALIETYPAVLGAEGAGVVVDVGEGVQGFAVNDRVVFQCLCDLVKRSIDGTFQQYALAPVGSTSKIPSSLTFEAASSIIGSLATVAFSLYNSAEGASSAKLTPPWEEGGRGKYAGKPFFVLGGSSSVGQLAIQLAHLSGFSPLISTASPHNTELLTSLGATHVLDRTLPAQTISAQARAIAGGGHFDVVFDAISLPDTLEAAYSATAPEGDLVVVLQTPIPGLDEKSKKRVHMARGLFLLPTNVALGQSLLAKLPQLLESGDIKPNPVVVLEGGLRGVEAGLERLRKNQVSGAKLVVKPQETA